MISVTSSCRKCEAMLESEVRDEDSKALLEGVYALHTVAERQHKAKCGGEIDRETRTIGEA